MARELTDWLSSYVEYASISEAPKIFHFWAGVSAIAGCLRRKVWFDQVKFVWFPGFFIVFVAPPGVATKSVTADGAMDLLRQVEGVKFGPDEITWQALVESFSAACESFEYQGDYHPMSPLTILSSEFGMMMDFKDSKLVNLFITLWDGRKQFEKKTKMSGNDTIEAPWVNLLACTTPQWISSNMDANTIGGGFTSRCIFVYGEKKSRPVAYIKRQVNGGDYDVLRNKLIHDLEHISLNLVGAYELTPEAEEWGTKWYDNLWETGYVPGNEDYINNYLARKQAHLHKLAMVLAASSHDDLIITYENLRLAETMLNETEKSIPMVFRRVGKTDESAQAARILSAIESKGEMLYKDVIRLSQAYFPDARDFEGIYASFIRAGQVELKQYPDGQPYLKWVGGKAP